MKKKDSFIVFFLKKYNQEYIQLYDKIKITSRNREISTSFKKVNSG